MMVSISFIVLILAGLATFIAVSILSWMAMKKFGHFWENYESVFKDSASANLSDMFLFVDSQQLFFINIIAMIVAPLLTLLLTGDILISLGVLAAVVILPFYGYRIMRQKRLKAFERQLPDALTMISGSLRAGASLNMAIEGLVSEQPPPISQEFELFLREQRIGVEFGRSLENMEQRLPIQDFQMFASAMRISREIGGNLAEILETLGSTLRRKAAMEGKIESLTAQGKMQGYVMTGLPILLGVALYYLEPEAMSKLFTEWYGWATVGVIVFMEGAGYFFISRITSIDV